MAIKKKFMLLVSLIVVLASFMTACSSSSDSASGKKDDGKIVIGAAMPTFDDKWVSYLIDSLKATAKENNVDLKMVDAKNDSSKQLSQVETFVTQGVDAIIIAAPDPSAIQPAIDAAKDADIPVVLVNRMPSDDVIKQVYAYVGSESVQSGTIQMEEVAKMLGGKGNVAIITGELGHEAQINRTKGNKNIIKKNLDMKVVRESTGNWQRSEGMKVMENWIQSGDKINAVVANNDEMAIGAIMALEAAGKLNDVVVAGIDGTPDALEYVKSGKLKVSAFQDPMGQGKKSIEMAIQAAKGEKLADKYVWVPFELITQENVDTYIEKWKSAGAN
ncbi:sugar ABC transporter substrate-binding protein [Ectobacillus funiculus]|uniref:Sugar ABC transporter substrate-binding protein n=1 Tax=Ectobacillus funiculus TaxID=137993 RepID=A0ABV5WM89_9BACI